MRDAVMHKVSESGVFEWPWAVASGLAILVGAAGGGGGGDGFEKGGIGSAGADGFVLFVPLCIAEGSE